MKRIVKIVQNFINPIWRKASGHTILETALVMPVLLGLVIGAVDVSNVLRSYSVLKEGVERSLRCVYTVNGKCVDVNPAVHTALYNVYRLDSTPEYYGYSWDYSGTERFFEAPDYRLYNFRATVLGSVSFSYNKYNWQVQRDFYPAVGESKRIVKIAKFPFIDNLDNRYLPENSTFSWRRSRGVAYPKASITQTAGHTINDVKLNSRRTTTATLKFTVPSPLPNIDSSYASLPCHLSNRVDKNANNHTPNTSTNCGSRYPDFTKIVLWIKGDSYNSERGSEGKVEISLSYVFNGERTVIDLGGREFSGVAARRRNDDGSLKPANASFVPRGAPQNYVSEGFRNAYPDEFSIHTSLPVPYNTEITVRFRLTSYNNKLLKWTGRKVKVFDALYNDTPYTLTAECEGGVPLSAEGEVTTQNNSSCTTNPPLSNINYIRITDHNNPLRSDPPVTIACSAVEPNWDEQMLAFGFNPEDYHPLEYDPSNTCGVVTATSSCPEAGTTGEHGSRANYGVSGDPNSDSRAQAQEICPPWNSDIENGAQPFNISWTETTVPLTSVQEVVWNTRTSCLEQMPTSEIIPSEYAVYPKLAFDQERVYNGRYIYTGSGEGRDPAVLVTNDPNYNCGEFLVRSRYWDEENNPPNDPVIPNTSLFHGIRQDLGCNWEEQLRNEAVTLGMNPQAYFEAQRDSQTVTQLPSEPSDSCVTYWQDNGAPTGETLLGTFPEDQIPAECNEEGVSCRLELVGFSGPETGTVTYDFDYAAEHFGFEEIKAGLPRAELNCSGPDCVRLSVNEQNGEFIASGEIDVPLNLLFHDTITLSYTQRQKWEGKYTQ
ncbi:MAG: hypothetical protein D6780_06340 [Candidatus Dadabacteria bacterium]|nr:MAG: hypothetical protein D6780_06340 [Candidatus Dadabacteria bacterium]